MTTSKIKLGIIGCGRLAQQAHLPILSQSPAVDLVALADIDAVNLQKAKRSAPRAREFKNYRELLAQSDIEAVIISTPTGTHAETAIAAFESNKHVYLEKPMAANLHQARPVLTAWKSSRKIGMLGFNYRFSQSYQALRQQIDAGDIGSLIGVRSIFNCSEAKLPAWKASRESGGGALLDLASHHIDLVRFVLRTEIQRVFACIQSVRTEADTATLQLDLENGLTVQCLFSLCSVAEQWFEVFGTEGKLRGRPYDRIDAERIEIMQPTGMPAKLWRALRASGALHAVLNRFQEPPLQASYRASLNHFLASIQTDRPASPDLMDGYHGLAVIEAAEESARAGQAICLSQLADSVV